MAAKRIKLPREANVGPEEAAARKLIDNGDVEGHGLPTTAPPVADAARVAATVARSPPGTSSTDENDGDEGDDVEGHVARQ